MTPILDRGTGAAILLLPSPSPTHVYFTGAVVEGVTGELCYHVQSEMGIRRIHRLSMNVPPNSICLAKMVKQ